MGEAHAPSGSGDPREHPGTAGAPGTTRSFDTADYVRLATTDGRFRGIGHSR